MGGNLNFAQQTMIAHADVIHQMKKKNPKKTLSLYQQMMALHVMNALIWILNTLDKMIRSFETMTPEINILEDFRIRVLNSLKKMFALN